MRKSMVRCATGSTIGWAPRFDAGKLVERLAATVDCLNELTEN